MPEFRNSGRGKKTRPRWFYSNPQLCSTKQENIFNRRGFIQQNKSTKHPLSIDVSNIKPLAIMTLKRQTGSMDSLLWKSQTTKLKSIYLHYKAQTTLTGFTAKSSQSLVHPWKQLSPVSQNKIDCYVFGKKKPCFGFFRPISGFFSPDFGFFRPGCSYEKMCFWKFWPEFVTKQALSLSA